jgi:hypothetical protein
VDKGRLRRLADRKGIGKDLVRAAPTGDERRRLDDGNRAFAFLDCIG